MKLFGFEVKKIEDEVEPLDVPTPVVPNNDDGAITVTNDAHYGIYVDLDATYRSELDLLHKYRQMALQPEMENAIDDIINEAIVHDVDGETVEIVLDNLDQSDAIKKKIRDEFKKILQLLDFGNFGHDIFRKWYIDGRLFYHIVIDETNPRDGIQTLVYVDPRKIKKIRNIIKKKNELGVEVVDRIEEFYIYTERPQGVNFNLPAPSTTSDGIPIAKDSIAYITSGLYDPIRGTVLSYLHKAIRPMNQLRFVEDATVIYCVSRAPERRVFYVDVGNMAKQKAEQYLKDIMTKYRNKLSYDASTGEVRDDRKHLSMLEDFWMPRRGNDKATEITTLQGGAHMGEMKHVEYFQKQLMKALGIPASRLEEDKGFSLGHSNEISRDEIKFDKFIDRLRSRFSILFDDLLKIQLTLRGVCTLEEWDEFKQKIHYDFKKDNNFAELKESELLQNRINTLNLIQPFIGVFFSKEWCQKNVLRMDEEEIKDMNEQMDTEMKDAQNQQHPPLAGLPPNPIMPPEMQDDNQPVVPGQQQPGGAQAKNNINNKTSNFFGGGKQ